MRTSLLCATKADTVAGFTAIPSQQWFGTHLARYDVFSNSKLRTRVCHHILKPPGTALGNLGRIILFIQPQFNYNSSLSESQLGPLTWITFLYYSPQLSLLTFTHPSVFLLFIGTDFTISILIIFFSKNVTISAIARSYYSCFIHILSMLLYSPKSDLLH